MKRSPALAAASPGINTMHPTHGAVHSRVFNLVRPNDFHLVYMETWWPVREYGLERIWTEEEASGIWTAMEVSPRS
jgi:hypothetical protein